MSKTEAGQPQKQDGVVSMPHPELTPQPPAQTADVPQPEPRWEKIDSAWAILPQRPMEPLDTMDKIVVAVNRGEQVYMVWCEVLQNVETREIKHVPIEVVDETIVTFPVADVDFNG